MSFLSDYLRSRTSDIHRRIESSSWSRSILDSDIEPSIYAAWLLGFLPFLRSCERQIKKSGILDEAKLEFIDRSKLILMDLQQLGISSKQSRLKLDDLNAWSCLYVCEGAQMGGLIMFRYLSQNKKIPPSALNYFGNNLKHRSKRWASIRKLLNNACSVDPEQIAADAVTCFERLHLGMQGLSME